MGAGLPKSPRAKSMVSMFKAKPSSPVSAAALPAAAEEVVLDVVVIGAGIGGLTACALLALEKKKVLLVEQSTNPPVAGCLRSFRDKDADFPLGQFAFTSFVEEKARARH